MLGPVHVLHLPEPSMLADTQFGPERAAELMAEGESMTTDDLVSALSASPTPATMPAGEADAQLADPPGREPAGAPG
jgi:hypothetical protein